LASAAIPFPDLHDRQGGAASEDLGGQALGMRVEVLDHDERRAAVRGHVREQGLERLEAAGGDADGDDRAGGGVHGSSAIHRRPKPSNRLV
jgi:hypothetical protein